MAVEVVLDASAILALLQFEPGADVVQSHLRGAAVSTVNIAEVGDSYLKRGGSRGELENAILELSLTIVAPDPDLALDAAGLLFPTRSAGLSLGDRFCLALCNRLGRPALTADRAWRQISAATGVEVILIR